MNSCNSHSGGRCDSLNRCSLLICSLHQVKNKRSAWRKVREVSWRGLRQRCFFTWRPSTINHPSEATIGQIHKLYFLCEKGGYSNTSLLWETCTGQAWWREGTKHKKYSFIRENGITLTTKVCFLDSFSSLGPCCLALLVILTVPAGVNSSSVLTPFLIPIRRMVHLWVGLCYIAFLA